MCVSVCSRVSVDVPGDVQRRRFIVIETGAVGGRFRSGHGQTDKYSEQSTYYRTDRRSPGSDTTQDEFVSVQKAKAKIETRSNIF